MKLAVLDEICVKPKSLSPFAIWASGVSGEPCYKYSQVLIDRPSELLILRNEVHSLKQDNIALRNAMAYNFAIIDSLKEYLPLLKEIQASHLEYKKNEEFVNNATSEMESRIKSRKGTGKKSNPFEDHDLIAGLAEEFE